MSFDSAFPCKICFVLPSILLSFIVNVCTKSLIPCGGGESYKEIFFMEVVQLQRSFVEFADSLFREGFLDGQFIQLQQLQDESNPEFVFEVVSLFFDDSEKILNEIARVLDQQNLDFIKVDVNVHQLKGSSASIGAARVARSCSAFRNFCDEQNIEGCLKCYQLVKQEYFLVKQKLETLFRMEQQIVAAGGAIPVLE